ncbi:MAG: PPC domain-containing protein [bacterium]|nr:PPC domain-containing protein [bacterium]
MKRLYSLFVTQLSRLALPAYSFRLQTSDFSLSHIAPWCYMGLILLCPALAWGQIATNEPSIGYVYPAGGRQGTTIRITVGGQNLRGLSKVYISGKGTSVSNIIYVPPMSRLQFQELQRRVTEIRNNRLGLPKVEGAAPAPSPAAALTPAPALNPILTPSQLQPGETPKPVTLPDHPLLRNLDQLSLTELKQVLDFFNPNRKQQIKRSIQELAIVDISIDADAPSGSRELRLVTPTGLTNPLCFQVGTMPESIEKEPNDVDTSAMQALDLPVLINGQIMPGDVDRFRFRARQGQRLVIVAQARRLIPYLPDAVPGWFQAVLALYDAAGKEVAYVDDYLTSPDPVVFYDVPQDGEYVAEIRDALYRGREDFVYRFSIQMRNANFKVPNSDEARISALEGALPEIAEHEPNDTFQKAQPAPLPQVVSGCIARPGDIDIYRFEGRAGDEITAEVYARRLDSPLDALLRLTDASGRVLAWSDDAVDKGSGLVTHHADSYIRFKLPKAGSYLIQLSDAQNQGGSEYIYRLRLSPLRPDFELRVTPSGIAYQREAPCRSVYMPCAVTDSTAISGLLSKTRRTVLL